MPHLALPEVREQLGETPGVGLQLVHPSAAEGALVDLDVRPEEP